MKVLIGCEESGTVRRVFREAGHDAWSCDLQPARDNSPYHIQGCVMEAVKQGWDLIILHPPCDYLAVSGNRWYAKGAPQYIKRIQSIRWTLNLWKLAKKHAPRVALENPASVIFPYLKRLGALIQYIQPWQFGHGETKKTGFALHNLQLLTPTNIVQGREQRVWLMSPGENRKRDRSETYAGIAQAMLQWTEPEQQLSLFNEGMICQS